METTNAFTINKAIFTKMYQKWTRSGSDNLDWIADFDALSRSSGELCEESKRALITFYTLKSGTPKADMDPLGFTLKTSPAGVTCDDVDEETVVYPRRAVTSRKRKRDEEAENSVLAERCTILKEGMKAVLQTLSSRFRACDNSVGERLRI